MTTQIVNQHPIRWKDWEKVVAKAAPRYLRRAHAAGARSVLLEDVRSELAVAWCIARDKFDPSLGVPFGAYLQRGMQNHINAWIDKQIGHVGMDIDDDLGEDGASFHDIIADGAPLQDETFGDRQEFEHNVARLSPDAQTFVRLLADPPLALYEEMTAIQARSDHANAQGIRSGVPGHITGSLVFDLMGCERTDRNRIYGEVKGLARQILG
ncbi:sigma factor [Methylorubrum extorquens]|uniref:sigma factor n=1 Tax=Methylorubrum extorquens TaxID=408 RepID=UPI00209CADCD|nr:sigma factor [Methylorubrum extorquens]MCP1540016.1 DNA-directed RNA polymerase specialized sigma24 family protein [Methylorubrum extorquens]